MSRTRAQLKTSIEREIAAIQKVTLEKVIGNPEKLSNYVVRAKGDHLNQIIFE